MKIKIPYSYPNGSKSVEVEALPLIMRKEFAQQIVDGTKKFEVRDCSPFYDRIFLNPAKKEEFAKFLKTGEHPNKKAWLDMHYYTRDTNDNDFPGWVHFHNYSNSWSLDVEIVDVDLAVADENYNSILNHIGCHELDEMVKECENEETLSLYYIITLGNIVNRENI